MASPVPTLVAVYDMGTWDPHRVAEFHLVGGRAELVVIDPERCGTAQHWYTRGVELLDSPRRIPPEDGAAFMRALLQPFRLSYCRIVDESPPAGNR